MIYLNLFLAFLQIGLFSIGGGYAAMPLIEAQTVTKYGWLTMNEFTDLVTIAEMTPGPIAVNAATFVGNRIAGLSGALCATFGCIFPSLIIVSLLAKVYLKYKDAPLLQNILETLRPVVVALILSAGVKILLQVMFGGQKAAFDTFYLPGVLLFALAFTVLRWKKPSPILVMVICGVVTLVGGMLFPGVFS